MSRRKGSGTPSKIVAFATDELKLELTPGQGALIAAFQQMSAPRRPNGVSKTGRVDASPKPHTSRSAAVGLTLRCLPR